MKTRFLIAFLFIALAITYCARAATVTIKVSDFPNTATVSGTDLFLVSVPGVTNKNITWNQLRALIGTNQPAVTVITNLTVINNLVSTNNYFQFITNQQFLSTNAYIENITNSTVNVTNVFNVSGKATLNIVNTLATTATNGFYVYTNLWSGGPTGTVDMALTDQGLASITACAVTGIINRSNTVTEWVGLSFTNTATTNWLLTLAGGIMIPERTNQVPVSNGYVGVLSMRYHPSFGTQAVYRSW